MSVRVGIIGFGVVGKSVLRFLKSPHCTKYFAQNEVGSPLSVWDKRVLSAQEAELLTANGAQSVSGAQQTLDQFFATHDYLIASPGINLRLHKDSFSKLLVELDIFSACWSKPVIAITGSLGKTSTTRMISVLLALKERVAVGGNIGTGMLDLLDLEHESDSAVIELSSFQLAYARFFAPKVAVMTNVFPNHLDWHPDMEDYFFSKCQVMMRQKASDYFVFSSQILKSMPNKAQELAELIRSQVYVMCEGMQESEEVWSLLPQAHLFYAHHTSLYRAWRRDGIVRTEKIFELNLLPNIGFPANWLITLTALFAYTGNLAWLYDKFRHDASLAQKVMSDLKQEHRIEHFATFNGIDFYNDSKSSITQATAAAVETLATQNRPIILILGGLGKGVDRSHFFDEMENNPAVKKVLYFGPEPLKMNRKNTYASLEELVRAIVDQAKPQDLVLFSPSGTSYDLFAIYTERGDKFKESIWREYQTR